MKTSRLLSVAVSAAVLGIGFLSSSDSFAQMSPAQQRAEAEARVRASRPIPQPRPQPLRPQQPERPVAQPGGGGYSRAGGSRPSGDGGQSSGREHFTQNHQYHEARRHSFYLANQALIDAWVAENNHLFVHAENSDGSAVGDADGYDWDQVSTDAVQACIDAADAADVDDSTCQVISFTRG